ncbi:hypothetical protein BDK51DRAFT_43209 [Blyttiomyces helicus]|uniref:Uncharacterized protein n=1 Tax=Blyttiomyces helicus TaxID=388810 RepID=A0A4V1IQY4_9FUNG|nr:hypothetical protein BDK51DRAFT_43209 [Blyttiomyces helicus]|eukprot:RKO88167.1 hypothetical protein BDK51DRAFT_43209 [Blyttiomyces helicus]
MRFDMMKIPPTKKLVSIYPEILTAAQVFAMRGTAAGTPAGFQGRLSPSPTAQVKGRGGEHAPAEQGGQYKASRPADDGVGTASEAARA